MFLIILLFMILLRKTLRFIIPNKMDIQNLSF